VTPSAAEQLPPPLPAPVTEDPDAALAEMLDSLSAADNYLDLIDQLTRPHLDGTVLEVGAGMGDLTERVSRSHPVVTTDVSPRWLAELEGRFEGHHGVRVATYDAIAGGEVSGGPSEGFGSALLVNVLEHLPNDVDSLSHLGRLVAPGGTIVTFVPAFDLLYGHFDRTVGHYRRYRKASLTETFTAAGLEPRLVRYVNLPGWFSWLLVVRVARLNPSRGSLVKAYDRLVVPMVRVVESRLAPPFGQSLLGVAEVPTA
jgi:SAM-dependent methyltransferase